MILSLNIVTNYETEIQSNPQLEHDAGHYPKNLTAAVDVPFVMANMQDG